MATRPTAAEKAAALATVADQLGVDRDALAALVAQKPAAATKAKAAPAAPAKSFAEQVEDAVTAGGYGFGKGRVYLHKPLLEAGARVATRKSDGFEIVQASKEGTHTAAVIVVKDGDKVYAQNLRKS